MSLESDDYSTWTVAELRDELQTRGIDVPSGSVKADLVQALESDDDVDEEDIDDDEYVEEDTEEVAIVGIHPFGTCVPLSPCPHTEEDAVTEPESDVEVQPVAESESDQESTDSNV